MLIEAPVALVPAHLSDFRRNRVKKEMDIIALRQFCHLLLDFLFPLPLRNDEEVAILREVSDPVPAEPRLAAPVGRDSIGVDKYIKHKKELKNAPKNVSADKHIDARRQTGRKAIDPAKTRNRNP